MKVRSIRGLEAVGAMVSWEDSAPFQRAALIARDSSTGELLKVRRYTSESVEGAELTQDEWSALLASKEATNISAVPLQADMWLWVLGTDFSFDHDEFVGSLGVAVKRLVTPPGVTAVLLNDSGLSTFRKRMAAEAADSARATIEGARSKRSHHGEALNQARTAYQLAPEVTPDVLAALVAAYRSVERGPRADALLSMANNTWGAAFRDQTREIADRLWSEDPMPRMRKARLAHVSGANVFSERKVA